jgi:hypothetical protein
MTVQVPFGHAAMVTGVQVKNIPLDELADRHDQRDGGTRTNPLLVAPADHLVLKLIATGRSDGQEFSTPIHLGYDASITTCGKTVMT